MPASILIVDDERTIRDSLRRFLEDEGYHVATAGSAEAALSAVGGHRYDVIVADIVLPGMSGLDLLGKLGAVASRPAVILITAYATVDSAVEALRNGAADYVRKPFKLDDLKFRIARAVGDRAGRGESGGVPDASRRLIGDSAAMNTLRERIGTIAATSSNVLLTGESGTGKEVVARAIHRASGRRGQRFVAVNCGAIPESLFESHLFGHARGAFTGAVQHTRGLFGAADHGTLYLDEIGELPLALQVKLLRAIEEREVWPIGAGAPVTVDIRVIASTNRDLDEEVRASRFRQDLFYRLKVVHIALPPLRARAEDIPALVAHFVRELNARLATRIEGVDEAAMAVLMAHDWNGNVRELEHVIESAAILAQRDRISPEHLPADLAASSRDRDERLRQAVRRFEREQVMRALARTNFDKREAARVLGVSLTSLYRKLGDETPSL
jgi:DNA-binding NtrC family response regulator